MDDVQESPALEGLAEDPGIAAESLDAASEDNQAISEAASAVDAPTAIEFAAPSLIASAAPAAPDDPDLLAELATAMHAAAERERERIEASVTDRLVAHLDGVRQRASGEGNELKRDAEADIKRIDDWASTEIARIRVEARRRTDERRDELAGHLRQHEERVEAEIAQVAEAIAAYRLHLDDFFADLRESVDPSDIAQRAAALPPMPDLDDLNATADTDALAGPEIEAPAAADTAGSSDSDRSDDEDGSDGADGVGPEDRAPIPVMVRPTPTTPVTAVVVGAEPVAEAAKFDEAPATEPEAEGTQAGVSAAVAQPRHSRGPLRFLRTIAGWSGDSEGDTTTASTELKPADERR
jgi:uncharacterized protein YicC (UPF0701 family)